MSAGSHSILVHLQTLGRYTLRACYHGEGIYFDKRAARGLVWLAGVSGPMLEAACAPRLWSRVRRAYARGRVCAVPMVEAACAPRL